MESSLLRQRARENLAGNWAPAIGAAVVAWLFGALMIGSSFIPKFESNEESRYTWALAGGYIRLNWNSAFSLVHLILGGVVQLGYAQYLLKQHDRQNPEISDLFSQFDRFGQGFAQAFLRGLYVFLWSLLFIIPGIVKTYSYAMTPYIMAENPELSANDAITASREMMDGHKGELFWLHLTFIGWDLLCALTLNLGHLALNPYKNAVDAAFYRELTAQKRNTM